VHSVRVVDFPLRGIGILRELGIFLVYSCWLVSKDLDDTP
jgi:hypothetical protein